MLCAWKHKILIREHECRSALAKYHPTSLRVEKKYTRETKKQLQKGTAVNHPAAWGWVDGGGRGATKPKLDSTKPHWAPGDKKQAIRGIVSLRSLHGLYKPHCRPVLSQDGCFNVLLKFSSENVKQTKRTLKVTNVKER